MQIKTIPVNDLIPYDGNARTHSDEQITEIADSIKRYGFTNPILLDGKKCIVAGHGRLLAAQKLGLESVPTIDLSFVSDAEKAKYIIADNKIALNAGWDYNMLNIQFDFIEDAGLDLDVMGFDDDEISNIRDMNKPIGGLTDDDEVPEVKEDAVCKIGDIWILGEHRLMCGDSTKIDDVDELMKNKIPIIMVTDPPYGVKYDPEWRDGADLGVGERSRGKVENDDKMDWTDAYSLFTGSVAYVWHAGIYSPEVAQHLRNCDFEIVSQIIWVKQHFALSRGDYHWQHEPCWYVVKKGHKHNWQGDRKQATIWEIKNNNSFGNVTPEKTWGHGTQKPIECMARPIINNSSNGDYIYDPFGGSGTTLIACEKHNRKCYMMEIAPNYCDVIIKRWQDYTGEDAIQELNKKTFNEVANGG